MMHFTCDCCQRSLDPDRDVRYVVRLEVYASFDPMERELDDDQDHLQELQDILEQMEAAQSDQIGDDVYQQLRYDLCSDCRKKFLRSPFGRLAAQPLDFSKN
jgi:hypothetical protein